ncbi:hypothetical protein AC1031_006885 [Aphanomyces cochlioides]|nr:hypothetical protein AC1031_006885 [Aphanomyces cochlioides]
MPRTKPPRTSLTLEQLESHYHMPLKEAAAKLGTYEGALIRACRRHAIYKWPYRQLSKINRQMRFMDDVLNKLDGDVGVKTTEQRQRLDQQYAIVHEMTARRPPATDLKVPKLKISFLLNA